MNSMARRLVEGLFGRLGYSLVPNWRVEGLAMERHLARLLDHFAIDCVFDVGANTGQYAQWLRRQVGYRGLIVSVEPIRDHAAGIERAAAGDPLWIVRNLALGAEKGKASINIARNTVFSSLLPPEESAKAAFGGANEQVTSQEIEIETFDALCTAIRQEHRIGNIYMKLDTQGYDLEVLKGAGASLDLVQAMQSEMSVIPIYVGMPDYRQALAVLEERGFVMSGIYPVSTDAAHRLMEFDCILVRNQG